jgi:hypothetical protein
MGVVVWVLGGVAAVVGLAVGYWWGDAERQKLQEEVAAKDEAVRDREVVARDKEQALAEKLREAEEKAHELAEQLRTAQESQEASPKKRSPGRKTAAKKVAKGTADKSDAS